MVRSVVGGSTREIMELANVVPPADCMIERDSEEKDFSAEARKSVRMGLSRTKKAVLAHRSHIKNLSRARRPAFDDPNDEGKGRDSGPPELPTDEHHAHGDPPALRYENDTDWLDVDAEPFDPTLSSEEVTDVEATMIAQAIQASLEDVPVSQYHTCGITSALPVESPTQTPVDKAPQGSSSFSFAELLDAPEFVPNFATVSISTTEWYFDAELPMEGTGTATADGEGATETPKKRKHRSRKRTNGGGAGNGVIKEDIQPQQPAKILAPVDNIPTAKTEAQNASRVWDGTNSVLKTESARKPASLSALSTEHSNVWEAAPDSTPTCTLPSNPAPKDSNGDASISQPSKAKRRRPRPKKPDLSVGVRWALERNEARENKSGPKSYVTQLITEEVESSINAFLAKVSQFQLRQVQQNPTKAKQKRRFVAGLREVARHLIRGKIKAVIVAKNVEETGSEVSHLLELCHLHGVSIIFGLTRRQLCEACRATRQAGVSVVGVMSIAGAEEEYKTLLSVAEEAGELWRNQFTARQEGGRNKYNSRGENPVWIAAWEGYGDPRVLDACARNGWSMDQPDDCLALTPLLAAAKRDNMVIFQNLLKRIPTLDITAKSGSGETIALILSLTGRTECLSQLLTLAMELDRIRGTPFTSGATALLLTTASPIGTTPLHAAAKLKTSECVRTLFTFADRCGMQLNPVGRDRQGATPIAVACQVGSVGTVKILLERAERPDGWMHSIFVGDNTTTPTIIAAKEGHFDVLQLMCRAASGELFQPPPPKRIGSYKKEVKIKPFKPDSSAVAVLLNARDILGRTCLWWAAFFAHLDIVRDILTQGGDPRIADLRGLRPVDVVGLGANGGAGQLDNRALDEVIKQIDAESSASETDDSDHDSDDTEGSVLGHPPPSKPVKKTKPSPSNEKHPASRSAKKVALTSLEKCMAIRDLLT
ncbi:Selenocysteine insertion sequence-binding protein 2-like [Gonapodya sp. JEL0774]|nr:Selenocysteine insertion sequence-binding protein 2-like [Gonapodya sp. JEL0774]